MDARRFALGATSAIAASARPRLALLLLLLLLLLPLLQIVKATSRRWSSSLAGLQPSFGGGEEGGSWRADLGGKLDLTWGYETGRRASRPLS